MKKLILIGILCLIMLVPLSAGQHLSVPLNHRVYEMIRSAELRGLIGPLPSMKPYTNAVIIGLLDDMLASGCLNEAEKREIEQVRSELTFTYEQPEGFSQLLSVGSYGAWRPDGTMAVAAGVNAESELTHSLTSLNLYDSRNVIRPYIRGDILDFASLYMDFGFRVDHIDPRLFLRNDFTIPCEGKYDSLLDPGTTTKNLPEDVGFYYGLDMHPEIALSFLDQNVQFRFASIQHDWGPALNNLQIASSARSFLGLETLVNVTDWLRLGFVAGSLGKFSLDTIDGEVFPSDLEHEDNYNNNFSAQRVEMDFFRNFTFGIYESVVYRKRFELGYLNPLSILMFEQNNLGDFDNMLAGVDFQWRVPGVLRAYAAWATTEMSEINPTRFFIDPRNIMGIQGGVDIHLPVAQFSTLTVQYTYLSPFFYTHKPIDGNYIPSNDGEEWIKEKNYIPFINKGEPIGYPMRPNSDELLLHASFGFDQGWRADATVKYQRRSGQYGFSYEPDKYMVYAAYEDGEYEDKDFAGNIFEKSLGVNLGVEKRLRGFPLTIRLAYLYTMHLERQKGPKDDQWWPLGDEEDGIPIHYIVEGPWADPTHTHALQIGFSLWK